MLWSYNQGSMIGAGVLLYQVTHDAAYLYQARQTAKAALAYFTPERLGGENPFFCRGVLPQHPLPGLRHPRPARAKARPSATSTTPGNTCA